MLAAMTQPSDRPGPTSRARDHPAGPQRAPDPLHADAVILTGADLTVADVEAVSRGGVPVRLDVDARVRMDEARAVVERLVAAGEVVYGITTGFGDLASTYIPPADARQLQENLLVSHAVGVGAPLPRDVVRAMLLLRANTFALGHSGCRPHPGGSAARLPRGGRPSGRAGKGSVGASGDLAPLAHLALPLIGRGEVELGGQVMPALLALRETGIEPITLEAKEGLALLNGTQLMRRAGALLLADADRLARTASVAAAQSVEALLGTDVPFAAAYQLARPHPGQLEVAAEMRHLLRGSGLMASHHRLGHKVQDPYSLRCVPQVHGAVRDALDHLRRVLDIELNSATDNPLVFPEGGAAAPHVAATGGGLVISGGNFHGEPVALALDFAKLGDLRAGRDLRAAESRSCRRAPEWGPAAVPAAPASGLNSGMMILQYVAAALASENKVARPPGLGRFDSHLGEPGGSRLDGLDRGRHARDVLANVEQILAIELLVGAQALDLRRAALTAPGINAEGDTTQAPFPGRGVAEAHRRIRALVAPLLVDREMGADMAAALALVRGGELAALVDAPDDERPAGGQRRRPFLATRAAVRT